MVEQKGSGLVCEANGALWNRDIFLVILGTGERRCEESLLELAARYQARVGVGIAFDEELAHLIEGDADIFLTPSRFEPCGLNQMYSMRYGMVTVVRSTGCLVDTVHPFDPETGVVAHDVVITRFGVNSLKGTLEIVPINHGDAARQFRQHL